ncbi:hypothetical protein V5G52_11215 [Trueperella pyogenes]
MEALRDEQPLSSATIEFAVGVDAGPHALSAGHVDLLARLDGTLSYRGEEKGRSFDRKPADAVVAVPHATRTQVPADSKWRFLGKPGDDAWCWRKRLSANTSTAKSIHTCGSTCTTPSLSSK